MTQHHSFNFPVLWLLRKPILNKYTDTPPPPVKLADDEFLVLEVKGQNRPKEDAKQQTMKEWYHTVTLQGSFGRWRTATSYNPNGLAGILAQHSK